MSFFADKKVLVAGGTGTIGTAVVKSLHDAEVTVVSMDNPKRVQDTIGGLATFKHGDLTDYGCCREAVAGQDYVFNFVGVKASTQLGVSKVASTFVPVLMANTNLMDAAFKEGIRRFMFVGSIGQYPNIPYRHEDNVWSGPPEANDRFMGIAKRAGEAQAESYMLQHKWNSVRVVRLSNVYGPYDNFDPSSAHVIPSLIHKMVSGHKSVSVIGDGSAKRDFIYLDDVVRGMLLAMEKAQPCQPINIGSGHGHSIREVVETILSLVEPKPTIEWLMSGPVGDSVRVLSVDRAKEVLDFETEISLQEGISKTIEWYRANKDMADIRGRELGG